MVQLCQVVRGQDTCPCCCCWHHGRKQVTYQHCCHRGVRSKASSLDDLMTGLVVESQRVSSTAVLVRAARALCMGSC